MSFLKWIYEFTDGLSVFSGPSLNVVAKQIRAASVGGATFEMSCTVSTENLGEVGYSVLIQSQDSLEGTVKTIMTLSPDSVLQHGGATDPGRRYAPGYMLHVNAHDLFGHTLSHKLIKTIHIFDALWDLLNISVIIVRIDFKYLFFFGFFLQTKPALQFSSKLIVHFASFYNSSVCFSCVYIQIQASDSVKRPAVTQARQLNSQLIVYFESFNLTSRQRYN